MSPISATEVDRMVRAEGEKVQHFIGMRCWCQGQDGQLSANCSAHDSTGSVYGEPTLLVGLFTDIMQRKELASTGFFLPGDAIFSPPSAAVVSEGDKFILLTPIAYGQGDALIRGVEPADNIFYSATSAIFCMDENKARYYEGTDFRLVGKTVEWVWTGKPTNGTKPTFGTRYTLKYKALVEWIAFVPPMERFSHGVDIGSKVMLRKRHLLGA